MTAAADQVMGETIGHFLQVDDTGIQRFVARICLTLPLNAPVRLERRIS